MSCCIIESCKGGNTGYGCHNCINNSLNEDIPDSELKDNYEFNNWEHDEDVEEVKPKKTKKVSKKVPATATAKKPCKEFCDECSSSFKKYIIAKRGASLFLSEKSFLNNGTIMGTDYTTDAEHALIVVDECEYTFEEIKRCCVILDLEMFEVKVTPIIVGKVSLDYEGIRKREREYDKDR